MNEKIMLTIQNTAERLNILPHVIRQMCRDDRIPGAYKNADNRWLIPELWDYIPPKQGRPQNSLKAFLRNNGFLWSGWQWKDRNNFSLGKKAGDAVWTVAITYSGSVAVRAKIILQEYGCMGKHKNQPVFSAEDGPRFGGYYVEHKKGMNYELF